MRDADKIIKKAKKEMQEMLRSVLDYNSMFLENEEQEKLFERILFAISVIDRKYFYEGREAYADYSLPIGEGQTISQPSTVARMLLLADLKERDAVLEVGTGSGWNASLISFLVFPGHVTSVELFVRLKEKAESNLQNLRNHLKQTKPEVYEKLEKINFFAESIFEKGKVWKRKYDKIIITAGIEPGQEKKVEMLAKKLLKQNGILICPHTSGPLIIYRKKGKLKKETTRESYVFVPLLDS
jgi:protein-L-isoaspartate(D-aspartate) O-methyltransferase